MLLLNFYWDDFWKVPKGGGWLSGGTNHLIRRLAHSVPFSDLPGEERGWKLSQSPMAHNLIDHASIMGTFADKGPSSQSYDSSSSHIQMWELDHKEGWVPKNWCCWNVVLEKTLESLLDSKELKPVSPKGNQPLNIHWKDWCWSWSSNTMAIWCKEPTHWKRPDTGKDWRQQGRTAEDEMVGWHPRLNEFEQTLGDGE